MNRISKFEESKRLLHRFHQVIPGGAHTYAKGDDQYPESAPLFISHGKGSHVWDADGNEFIEYGNGLRSVTLGHGFEPVVEAVRREVGKGTNFNRPSVLEVECATALLELLPRADMVKFAKNGSDVNDAAVKLARAYTGRERIACCGDQPFFSIGDWFMGSTVMGAGIPQAVKELTLKFRYNDLDSVSALFQKHPGQIAAVILELEKEIPPANDFLPRLKDLCRQEGALLIVDEMITGFRWHNGGAQAYYDIEPDLSTFGKGLGNGFSLSALAGRREIMRLGGLVHDRPRVFLLSTTHGAETHTLAAGLEVIRTYQHEPVIQTIWERGQKLAESIRKVIAELKLEGFFVLTGKPCCLMYGACDAERRPSQVFRTLFLQELLKRGILAPSFVISYSHSDEDVRQTVEAIHDALVVYRKALEEGVGNYLQGRAVKPVFRAFN